MNDGAAALPTGLCNAPGEGGCKPWAIFCRVLDDGRVVHLLPLMYTVRICVASGASNGMGGFDEGWCYAQERMIEAVVIAATWDFQGDPPGPWIRNLRGRYGPGASRRPDDDGDEAA